MGARLHIRAFIVTVWGRPEYAHHLGILQFTQQRQSACQLTTSATAIDQLPRGTDHGWQPKCRLFSTACPFPPSSVKIIASGSCQAHRQQLDLIYGDSMFTDEIQEELRYYVYFLRDPRNEQVFYVGKGKGNRLFDHVACEIDAPTESDKLALIRGVRESGREVEHFVLRHGMTEDTALEVEAAVIDFVGLNALANVQAGHYSTDFGIKTVAEVVAMYQAAQLATSEPVILLNIGKLYDRQMSDEEVYAATRSAWVVGPKRNKAKYAVATCRGITRAVFEVQNWVSEPDGRWSFNGALAEDPIRGELKGKSVAHLAKRGAANPVRYLNCQ